VSENVPKSRTERAYLGIGSNLGDRISHLQAAVDGIASSDGVEVVAVSPVYETDPVGGPEQGEFLNAVVAIDTTLSPRDLLELAQRLEAEAHRVHTEKWGPRTLDVDVLLVGDQEVHEPDLEIPHPRMWERGFVMVPLGDVDPARAADSPPGGWSGVRRTDLSLRLP
jgi:2-amino-4-hydroxy-6-hydroxymethyldihydropteridine diphosphokinase